MATIAAEAQASISAPKTGSRLIGPTGRVVIASVLTVVGTVFLIGAVTMSAVQRVDGMAAASQLRLLQSSIQEDLEKVPYDQESVAIWDDAIQHARTEKNVDWLENNIGSWLAEYFKHDDIAVLNESGAVIYSHSKDDDPVRDAFANSDDLKRLVADLRKQISEGALDKYEAGETRLPSSADRIIWRTRPAVVSVVPIVSDTKEIKQERGSEFILVSTRFIDGNFISHEATRHELKDARFSRGGDVAADEQSLAIPNAAGSVIGYLVWTPVRPGGEFLSSMLPALAGGLLAFAGLIAALVYNLLTSYRRLQQSEHAARYASRHDVLTGLPNRGYFEERLTEALNQSGVSVGLFFLDLDRFKQVNDTLGHPAGDLLIQTFARRLAKHLAPEEFLARLGGDEFAIILPRGSNQGRLDALSQAILTAAGTPFWLSTTQAMVGASIGIALSKPDDQPSDLTRKADIALYQAKNAGRHRWAVWSCSN